MVDASTALDNPELRLPRPAVRGFDAAGYVTLGDVWAAEDSELTQLHGVGLKALRMIEDLRH